MPNQQNRQTNVDMNMNILTNILNVHNDEINNKNASINKINNQINIINNNIGNQLVQRLQDFENYEVKGNDERSNIHENQFLTFGI